jgi:murein DD-endopeptidase MepM/ murein hydrolase activator NlpD
VDAQAPRARNLFIHFICRNACAGAAFALLYALLFSGTANLLLHHTSSHPKAKPEERIPAIRSSVPEFREVMGVFEKQQTITFALAKQGLPDTLIRQIIDCARPVYNLARVKAGQAYWVYFSLDGSFRDFRYPVDDERYLTVYHDAKQDRLVSIMKNISYETRVGTVSASIDSSLFSAVLDLGERDQLALELADIFGSDIDFYTDIQKGDSFKVLIEKKYLNGQFTKYGAILAAAFTNKHKLLTGYRFEDENGKPAYYGPDGQALKRSFLKSPLKFARVSSRFSRARMHPILKVLRPHLGVDYAAQAGTPVQAVGAGKVTAAGYNGESGRMVKIAHSGGYVTMYLHLSRIAVRSGDHVSQGQVIGNVGSTGLSTGSHLDFRVQQHGKAINPLKVIFPPGLPVAPSSFNSFAALCGNLNRQLLATNNALNHAP